MVRARRGRAAALLVALALASACTGGGGDGGPSSTSSPSSTGVARPRGGTAIVGVWGEPDPAAATLAGAGVRALVLPQLFVAGPDGRWSPSLVAPGSVVVAADVRSASFQLRPGAVWSDGSAITADDLRRSADPRFVAGVDGPGGDGTVVVRFTQALPGWQRLWSGVDSVAAPRPGVWGGAFVVASYERGLQVVLQENPRWYGGRANLDEVRLVLVPDPVTARQLLAAGRLDVVMPPAATVRTRQLEAIGGVSVAGVARSGWWVGLLLRADRLAAGRRASLVASVDRVRFVATLLRDEAVVLDGFSGASTWAGVVAGSPDGLAGVTVDLVGELEEPMTPTLQRSMQRRAHPRGAMLELRNAEADRVEPWVAAGTYDAAVVMQFDGPSVCWTCRWAGVDEALARSADAGDRAAAAALEARLRDESLLLPLWRPRALVAWRDGLGGVRANGYALNAAWNAWEWWRAPAVQ